MTKKLITILLIVALIGFATLAFFYWQMRVELVGQTKKIEDLLKQIDTLEKQIEELGKQTKEVTIATDKTEYEQGEIIEMSLINPLDSPIYYYWNGWPSSSWWSIYRLNEIEDTWEKIKIGCTFPPGAVISCDGEQGPFWDPGPGGCLNITSKSKQIKWSQEVCEVKENHCPVGSKVESYFSIVWEPAQPGQYKFVATYQQSACKTELKTLEALFIIK